jgi:hypothetical protein
VAASQSAASGAACRQQHFSRRSGAVANGWRNLRLMGVAEAAEWGLAGGVAAGLVALSAAVMAVGYKWPWRDDPGGVWPRLFVTVAGLAVGVLVSSAAHSEIGGAWPAFLLGVGAPSVIRGAIARVEVTPIGPVEEPASSTSGSDRPADSNVVEKVPIQGDGS